MKLIKILFFIFLTQLGMSSEIIKYEFNKHQKVDLSDLNVDGKIMAPRDISIKDRENVLVDTEFFKRKTFSEYINKRMKFYGK
jgi:hypothetical protein